MYIPGVGTSHRRDESLYLEWEPITGGTGRYIPGGQTSHRRDEGIYLEWEPITGGTRVYTWSGNQSQKERGFIPLIYLEWEPITGGARVYSINIPGVRTNYRRDEGIYLE